MAEKMYLTRFGLQTADNYCEEVADRLIHKLTLFSELFAQSRHDADAVDALGMSYLLDDMREDAQTLQAHYIDKQKINCGTLWNPNREAQDE